MSQRFNVVVWTVTQRLPYLPTMVRGVRVPLLVLSHFITFEEPYNKFLDVTGPFYKEIIFILFEKFCLITLVRLLSTKNWLR